jgi:predicted ATP-grasp superfamily ATP-dependent carboligase
VPRSLRTSIISHRNRFYVRLEKLLAAVSPGRSLRVLVSSGKPDWQKDIRAGFDGTPHRLEFGEITAESISDYDLVVPLTVEDLHTLNECSALLHNNPIPAPSKECLRLCNDKYEFNRRLIDAGFGKYIPRMGNLEDFEPPYMLKKRIGEWGKDCYVIRDRYDEQVNLEQARDPEFFCQQFVPGRFEFATHILFAGNRIVKALNIMYEFENETPIKGQDRDLYKAIHRCEFLELFSRVLREVGFQGICCVNYKVAHGKPFILEVNPRFGGSLGPYFFSFLRCLGDRRGVPTSKSAETDRFRKRALREKKRRKAHP